MHLTHLKITDFMGIKAADMALVKPINLFMGPNEAGKSSIRDAVLYGLTGNARGLKNEDARGGLIRAGAKAAEVTVTFTDNGSDPLTFTRRKTPKTPGAVTGDMPMPVEGLPLPVLLDTRTFFEYDSGVRRALLFKLIPGMNPTGEDLTKRAAGWLKKTGIKPIPEFQFGLKKLVNQAVRDGFQTAENEAVGKRREAKRAREVNAGYAAEPAKEVTVNEIVYILPDVDREALGITLKTLKARRDELLKATGRLEGTEESLQDAEKALAAAQMNLGTPIDPETVEQAKKDLALATGAYGDASGVHDLAAAAHKKAVEELRALEQPVAEEEKFPQFCPAIKNVKVACTVAGMVAFTCDDHGPVDLADSEKVVLIAEAAKEDASIAKIEARATMDKAGQVVRDHDALAAGRAEQVKEIDRLDAKVKGLRAQTSNAHAAENLVKLEAEIAEKARLQDAIVAFWLAMNKVTEAVGLVDKCDAEIAFYDALAKAMAPEGIPTQMIAESLAPVNNLLAVAAGHLFPGRTLALTPELDFALEGAPLLSKSAELRVGVAIQYVLAKLAGARLLMVDEVDMLDPGNRKGFVAFLRAVQADFDTVLAFSTAAPSAAPFEDVQVWAVNDGTVTAL